MLTQAQGIELGNPTFSIILPVLFLAMMTANCSYNESVPELEQRAQSINREVMCPVCPGESIDQSQNPVAAQMRDIVTSRLREGWTEKQIKDYFVESYDHRVLMEPPRTGVNLIAWLVPPSILVVGIFTLVFALRFIHRSHDKHLGSTAVLTSYEQRDYFASIEAIAGLTGNQPSSSNDDTGDNSR